MKLVKFSILLLILPIFIPAFGQSEWYDDWVGNEIQENITASISDENFIVEEFATGFFLPTTMTFVDDDILLLQKNDGKVFHIKSDGYIQSNPVLDVNVSNMYESGLLGITSKDSSVYLYYTEANEDGSEPIANNVYRYQWNENILEEPTLIKSLPVYETLIHNGGAMTVDNDGIVYAVIGDQKMIQGTGILHNHYGPPDDTSVILPVDPPGDYFTIGIRNSFGLAIDPLTGNLWATENGHDYFDEINLFLPYSNSGWNAHTGPINESRIYFIEVPDFLGVLKSNIQLFLSSIYDSFFLSQNYEYSEPEFSWEIPVSPTGLAFASNSFGKFDNWLFVGDCNSGNIYKFQLNTDRNGFVFNDPNLQDLIKNEQDSFEEIHFGKGFGCITDIEFHNNEMYVTSLTSGTIYKIYFNE